MTTRGTPFMAPLGGELNCYNLRSWHLGDHSLQGFWKNCASVWLEEFVPKQLLALRLMAAMGSRVCIRSITNGNSGQARWCPILRNLEKMKEDSSQGGGREMSPGERWFTMENSPAECRALSRLEKELEAPLLCEHGGEYRASTH